MSETDRISESRRDGGDCEHGHVRYFADEKGAIACMECGRLFGHLVGEFMVPHNPCGASFVKENANA